MNGFRLVCLCDYVSRDRPDCQDNHDVVLRMPNTTRSQDCVSNDAAVTHAWPVSKTQPIKSLYPSKAKLQLSAPLGAFKFTIVRIGRSG
jgi:hypothetical protein